jgi:hypothetical protein
MNSDVILQTWTIILMDWHDWIKIKKNRRPGTTPRGSPEDCPAPCEIPSPQNKRSRAVHVPRTVDDGITFLRLSAEDMERAPG